MEALYILLGLLILGLVAYGIYVYTTDGPKKLFGDNVETCKYVTDNYGELCVHVCKSGEGCPSCDTLQRGRVQIIPKCEGS